MEPRLPNERFCSDKKETDSHKKKRLQEEEEEVEVSIRVETLRLR